MSHDVSSAQDLYTVGKTVGSFRRPGERKALNAKTLLPRKTLEDAGRIARGREVAYQSVSHVEKSFQRGRTAVVSLKTRLPCPSVAYCSALVVSV